MTKPLRRRVDALAKAVPPSMVERLEGLTDRVDAAHRIGNWTADQITFETYFSRGLDAARQELIAAAVRHRVHEWTLGPPLVKEWRVHLLAAAAVDLEPGSPRQLEALEALQWYAQAPAAEYRDGRDPWDSDWLEANRHLVTLGADQGGALHHQVAEASEEPQAEWNDSRRRLAAEISEGTARRVAFLVWVQPDLEQRRERLLAKALERRTRRSSGEILEIGDVSDAAAELVSYLPGEPVPEEATWLLQVCRDQHAAPGTPSHEEWVEANELHWVVGHNDAKQMRERMEIMAKEGDMVTT